MIHESPALELCELLVQYEESQEPGCTVEVERTGPITETRHVLLCRGGQKEER